MASPTVRFRSARTTRATARFAGSYRVARARRERTRKGRPARRGQNHGRHGGETTRRLWPLARQGLSTGGWLVSSRCTRAHAHAQRHRHGNGWRARAWVRGGAADRRRAARRRGWGGLGLRWSAHVSKRIGVRAQERPDARAIRVEWYHGERRLGSPRRNAAELDFGRGTGRQKGRAFTPSLVNACTSAGAWARG
jgi:hypothetical protein